MGLRYEYEDMLRRARSIAPLDRSSPLVETLPKRPPWKLLATMISPLVSADPARSRAKLIEALRMCAGYELASFVSIPGAYRVGIRYLPSGRPPKVLTLSYEK